MKLIKEIKHLYKKVYCLLTTGFTCCQLFDAHVTIKRLIIEHIKYAEREGIKGYPTRFVNVNFQYSNKKEEWDEVLDFIKFWFEQPEISSSYDEEQLQKALDLFSKNFHHFWI